MLYSAHEGSFGCLLTNHRVTCWGNNDYGHLGRNDSVHVGALASDMSNLTFISFTASLNTLSVLEVSVSFGHACALLDANKLICWGENSDGELGAEVALSTHMGDDPLEMVSLSPILFKPSIVPAFTVIQVVAVYSATCALFSNGRIICWGDGSHGVTGRDTTGDIGDIGTMATLNFIVFSDDVPAIQLAGMAHACAVFANGRVRCWGYNGNQQLGDTTYENRGSGTQHSSITEARYVSFSPTINTIPIVSVTCGYSSTCALFAYGRLICFGGYNNSFGQLGTVFAQVQAVSWCDAASCLPVSSAGFISFSDSPNVSAKFVECGLYHTCVLFDNTKMLCFGHNADAQLGTDSLTNVSGPAGGILSVQPYISFSSTLPISSFAIGFGHTCVIRCDGAVLCFGKNAAGQLGRGSITTYGGSIGDMVSLQPVAFDPLKIPTSSANCPPRILTLVVTPALSGFDPEKTFYLMRATWADSIFSVTSFTTSTGNSITINGMSTAWIPLETMTIVNKISLVINSPGSPTYTIFVRSGRRVAVVTGESLTCILSNASRIACFGEGDNGRTGRDAVTDIGTNPTDMSNLNFISFTASLNALAITELSSTRTHVCVIFDTGSVVCFGCNTYGNLGANLSASSGVGDTPGEMVALVPIVFKASVATSTPIQVSAGDLITCVLFSNGGVVCFGYGSNGALGQDNSNTVGALGGVAALDFIKFSDTIPAIQISAYQHVCAVFANHRVRCWGQSENNELGLITPFAKGLGPSPYSITDTQFITFAPTINTIPIAHVSAGLYYSCGLFINGKAICWGGYYSSFGQLGTVFTQAQSVGHCGAASCVPVSSIGFISFSVNSGLVVEIKTSERHTCVLLSIERIVCFGSGLNGRLGSQTSTDVGGPTGPPLSNQPNINFGIMGRVSSVDVGYTHTCLLNCGGSVICFGSNASGELGNGNMIELGGVAGDLTLLGIVPFDPAKILTLPPSTCKAYMTNLVLTTGPVPGFTYNIFSYVIAVPSGTTTVSVSTFTLDPIGGTLSVNVNGGSPATVVPVNPRILTEVINIYI